MGSFTGVSRDDSNDTRQLKCTPSTVNKASGVLRHEMPEAAAGALRHSVGRLLWRRCGHGHRPARGHRSGANIGEIDFGHPQVELPQYRIGKLVVVLEAAA